MGTWAPDGGVAGIWAPVHGAVETWAPALGTWAPDGGVMGTLPLDNGVEEGPFLHFEVDFGFEDIVKLFKLLNLQTHAFY